MTEVDNGLKEIMEQAVNQLTEVITKGVFNEIINAKDTEDFVKKSYGADADLANDHISNNGYSYNEALEFFENIISDKEERKSYMKKVQENVDTYLSDTIAQCNNIDDKILKIHRIYDCIEKNNESIGSLVDLSSVTKFKKQVESVKNEARDFNEKIESEKNKEREVAAGRLAEVIKEIFDKTTDVKDTTEDFVKKSYGADLANDHISNNGYSYNEAYEFFENVIPKEERDSYEEKIQKNLDNYLTSTITQYDDNIDNKSLKIHRIHDSLDKITDDIINTGIKTDTNLNGRASLINKFSLPNTSKLTILLGGGEKEEENAKNTKYLNNVKYYNEKVKTETDKENLLKDKLKEKKDILSVEKMGSDEIFAILAERDEMERKMKEEEKTEKELANKANEKREERRKERENLTKSQEEAKVAREEAEKAKEEAKSIFAGKKLKQKAEKAIKEAKAKESVVEEINKKIVDLEENIKALGNLEGLANTEKQKYTEKKLIDDSEIEKFEKQLNSMKKSIEYHKDEELTSYKEIIENLKPTIQKWQEVYDKDISKGVINEEFKEKLNETLELYGNAEKDIVAREDVERNQKSAETPISTEQQGNIEQEEITEKAISAEQQEGNNQKKPISLADFTRPKDRKRIEKEKERKKIGEGIVPNDANPIETVNVMAEMAQKYTKEYNNLSTEEKEARQEARRRAEEGFNFEAASIERFAGEIVKVIKGKNNNEEQLIKFLIEATNVMEKEEREKFLSDLKGEIAINQDTKTKGDTAKMNTFFNHYREEVKKELKKKPRTEQLREQPQGQRTRY